MQNMIKLKELAALLTRLSQPAPDGALWDAETSGYQVATSRCLDNRGRVLGWIITATRDETKHRSERGAEEGLPEEFIVSGNGRTPRMFPNPGAVYKWLDKYGCWNFLVHCD